MFQPRPEAIVAPLSLPLALEHVRDGDLACLRGRHPLSSLIVRLSGGRYSHVGLFFRWGERVMIVHASRGGVAAVPVERLLQTYDGTIERYALRDEHRLPGVEHRLRDAALEHVGAPFASVDLALVGLHYAVGTPLPSRENPPRFVCSHFVAHCFAGTGIDVAGDKALLAITPDDLASSHCFEHAGALLAG